jgi:hypothetical protein
MFPYAHLHFNHKPFSPSKEFGNSDTLGFEEFPPSSRQLSMRGFFSGGW